MRSATPPGLALFYDRGRAPDLMGDAQRDGLAPFRLLTHEPVAAPTNLPDSVLAEIELVISGWGCPCLDEPLLERMPKLRFVAHTGSAVKPIVSPSFWSRGIRISSAAAANARPVAEYALAAILWANKQVLAAREFYRDKGRPQRYPWTAPDTPGNCGPTIGIVGASRTGRHLMNLLSHFDMTVLLADPYADAAALSDANIRLVDREELAALSDVVSLHAPLTDETRGMIDAAFLARMKQGATLVNTGRGGLVDQDALVTGLRGGGIFAILDVTEPEPLPPDSPLLSLPNAFVSPHVAGAAGYETRRLANLAISETLRFHLGEPLLHEVLQRHAERFG
ncbi:hydroxyacid dehydrogenase [Bosea vestrisii]|uniref:hydroxyacid dehydrogenase n=1 Tax=Bosea vestrisii TaxID=151416 RepID=UPI0024DF5C8F|nr:hydroxyacid dehydrogenase [Bosea vestrisii]WID98869.1 hydroxyacid dehydrogenase [Bosea vestrisii]